MEEKEKVVEKYYIEIPASIKKRFLIGLVQGVGWGVGISAGTALILYLIGLILSKVDFVPIFGQFLAEIIKSAQGNLNTR